MPAAKLMAAKPSTATASMQRFQLLAPASRPSTPATSKYPAARKPKASGSPMLAAR